MKKITPAQKFNALKKYISHLRVCVFADYINRVPESSSEGKILTYCKRLFRTGMFNALCSYIGKKDSVFNAEDYNLVEQTKLFFNLVFKFESEKYGAGKSAKKATTKESA